MVFTGSSTKPVELWELNEIIHGKCSEAPAMRSAGLGCCSGQGLKQVSAGHPPEVQPTVWAAAVEGAVVERALDSESRDWDSGLGSVTYCVNRDHHRPSGASHLQ